MFKPSKIYRSIRPGVALAGFLVASVASAPAAFAGECPADKNEAECRPDGRPQGGRRH